MIPSPILKVLSSMRAHQVQCLLMGGQACILYGAAEFSRDTDLAILAAPDNLRRLGAAVAALGATVTAVPPFQAEYLDRGHAVHFRCEREDVRGLRVDVMSRMRGVDPFAALWERRTTFRLFEEHDAAPHVEALALPDLVAAKKTQCDKDWPMVRRLVEANYFEFRAYPTPPRIAFWLRELRTPELLVECARAFPAEATGIGGQRTAVQAATDGELARVEAELLAEQEREREVDRAYWAPLRTELERLRHKQRGRPE